MGIAFEQRAVAQWRNIVSGKCGVGAMGGNNGVDFNFTSLTRN